MIAALTWNSIPTWVFTSITVSLLLVTLVVAVKTEGGIKKPLRLLALAVITVVYVFSLTFIQNVTPQLGLDLKGGVSVVLEVKGNPSTDEIDVAKDVIDSRVNSLGVAEPEVSREGNNIVVNLPGAKNARKAQELIGQTAELRFREVAENSSTDQQVLQVLQQIAINEQAKTSGSKSSKATTGNKTKSTTTTSTSATSTTTSEGGPGKSARKVSTTTTSTTTSTTIAPTTTTSPAAISSLSVTCGGTNPKTFTLTGDLTKPTPRNEDKADQPIIAMSKATKDTPAIPSLLCPAVLKGDIVKNASRQVDQLGEISVGVQLTKDGGNKFTSLIGAPLSNQRVAIVLDSVIISAPEIQPELADGLDNNELQITIGDSKNQTSEIDDLIKVLNFGKLNVVLEQQTAQKISPTLGTDQLKAGLIAGAIGLLLVAIYMLLYYRVLALVVLTGITLSGMTTYALISWLGQSSGLALTLSGAVGLIVSLGVTVDSYVVYFEKLKDEVRQGRSIRSCLDTAFKASFKTILAADLVSLIGATVLYFLASGSVRGFAFFLGLATILDLVISLCFMHPMVKLLAQNKKMVTMKFFGIASALDKKDLTN